MVQVTEIQRLSAAAQAETAARFDELDRPLILERAVRSWPAVARWTPEYLKRLLGAVPVQYKLSASHKHPDFHQPTLGKMFAREGGTFGTLLDLITSGPREQRAHRLFTGDEQFLLQRRAGTTTVNAALEPLLRDVEIPALVPSDRLYTIWGWFSGPGVRTWLHYDNNGCHNLNAQITGRKQCVLYPPEALARMFPFPLGGKNPAYNCCAVDVEQPDAAAFPGFSDQPRWEGALQPGDLLFIPAWWFHTFFHVGDFNSNVNFWWKPARVSPNPVASRQAVIDAVAAAGVVAAPGSPEAALLAQLDEALTRAAVQT